MLNIIKLLEKIKSRGYWKVIIRPTKYKKDLILSLNACKKIIESSKVSLRGWDYPHIDHKDFIQNVSQDSVCSFCDWDDGGKFEYWRFYKTGQFIHYFEMREDWELSDEKKQELQSIFHVKSEKFFSILSALYLFTEIFEFSSRLTSKIENIDGVEIVIELHGVGDRTLFFWDQFMRTLYRAYTCVYAEDFAKITRIVTKEQLLKESDEISLEETIKLFRDVFGWDGASKDIFKEDQKKLLERRL